MAEPPTRLNIGVVGAGAIGGWLAARLSLAGHDVALLTRPGRAADYADGLTLVDGEERRLAPLRAGDDAAAIGRQDLVLFAVKAFGLADAVEAARPLLGDDTLVVPLVNGVPFWLTTDPLETVDPGGRIAAALPAARVVGSVVHASAQRTGPAKVRINKVDHLILGEAGGGPSARVDQLAKIFESAGVPALADPEVRRAAWYKAWGNMTVNPLSALTLATADQLVAECRDFLLAAMEEARAIGTAIGIVIDERGEERLAVTARLGAFKTSMLQDIEAGRRIELEALLGAPLELARRHGVAAPNLRSLYAMTRLMAERRGLL